MKTVVQDTGSGINKIVITISHNLDVYVPPFTPGTTDPIVILATVINSARWAQLALDVFDMAGNKTSCDPVLTEVDTVEAPGAFTGLLEEERWVTCRNNTPGITNLINTVNGTPVRMDGLTDGEIRVLELTTPPMLADGVDSYGNVFGRNTMELAAEGAPDSSAQVIIAACPCG